jgi:hypothetical protein
MLKELTVMDSDCRDKSKAQKAGLRFSIQNLKFGTSLSCLSLLTAFQGDDYFA